jgi:hypothetical protein
MNGNSVGKITVYYRTAYGGRFEELWSKSDSIGEIWERAQVQIKDIKDNMQIIIEAQVSTNSNLQGVIAIDDISFSKTCQKFTGQLPTVVTTTTQPPCGLNGFICADGSCINKSQACDFIIDCPSGEDESSCGTCNFETDNCGWYDNSYGDHLWNRTTASLTNIPFDATYNLSIGNFMFYQISTNDFSGLTRLFTPRLGKSGSHCEFEFFYYKKDQTPKPFVSLSLFLVDSNSKIQRLWKTEDISTNNKWIHKTIGIHSRDAGFKLYFEASQLDQIIWLDNQLAIDDTKFTNCPIIATTSCLVNDTFKCANNLCIPKNLVKLHFSFDVLFILSIL